MAYSCLVKPNDEQKVRVQSHIARMNALAETGPYVEGIMCKLYAPKDTRNIQEGERCFYTRENALIIDTVRKYIETIDKDIIKYCLAPLLTKASIHTNTAGVFKGFYKNGTRGCFGGRARNALPRITKPIRFDVPLWSDETYTAYVSNMDINNLVNELPDTIDVMYLDPPYNHHPYGSNYFMLNVIAENKEPTELSKVSGIPAFWNKSKYNSTKTAFHSMRELIKKGLSKSKFLLISYNDKGIIRASEWATLFKEYTVNLFEIKYDTYKGGRKGQKSCEKVMEKLFLVSK
jgi:adenine-specific DNA-methyltransferase